MATNLWDPLQEPIMVPLQEPEMVPVEADREHDKERRVMSLYIGYSFQVFSRNHLL